MLRGEWHWGQVRAILITVAVVNYSEGAGVDSMGCWSCLLIIICPDLRKENSNVMADSRERELAMRVLR